MAIPVAMFRAVNKDARHWQLLALSALFFLSRFVSDFGAEFPALGAALSGAMLAQFVGSKATGTNFQWKSAAITTLGITILLRASDPVFWFGAGLIGIGLKFLVRFNNKHIFNPACVGIAVVTLASAGAWVSPGQWGQTPVVAAFVMGFAALVLSSAKRLDIALGFLGFFAALLFGRAMWLGDPLVIPAHQMQNGALLVFAFFMITDPRSTPDSRLGRLIFAAAVAGFAAWLGWGPHVRGGMIYALAALAPLTILLDRMFPAGRFEWTPNNKNEEGTGNETQDIDDGGGVRAHAAGT
ncbi:MAG: RnfABCDGE type electron transport complex subunit D [Hyphomonadaceae bacterium]